MKVVADEIIFPEWVKLVNLDVIISSYGLLKSDLET